MEPYGKVIRTYADRGSNKFGVEGANKFKKVIAARSGGESHGVVKIH
jgi:hypothetical protein